MKERLKGLMNKVKEKVIYSTALATALFINMSVTASASGITNKSSDDIFNGMYGLVLDLMQKAGIGVLIFGGIQMGIAFTNENSDAKIKAAMFIAFGIFLFSFKIGINLAIGTNF